MSYRYLGGQPYPSDHKFKAGDRVVLVRPQTFNGSTLPSGEKPADIGTEFIVILPTGAEKVLSTPHVVCKLANVGDWTKLKWVGEDCLELASQQDPDQEIAVLLGIQPTVETLVDLIEQGDEKWNTVTRRQAIAIAKVLSKAPIWPRGNP